MSASPQDKSGAPKPDYTPREIVDARARIAASMALCQAIAALGYSVLSFFYKTEAERAGFDLPMMPVKNFADRLHEYLSLRDYQRIADITADPAYVPGSAQQKAADEKAE
jgi:hypothetical protein